MAKKKDIQSFSSDAETHQAIEELMEATGERNLSALIRDTIDYALQNPDDFKNNRRSVREMFQGDRGGFQPVTVFLFVLYSLLIFAAGNIVGRIL